jgi:hypothetical protein
MECESVDWNQMSQNRAQSPCCGSGNEPVGFHKWEESQQMRQYVLVVIVDAFKFSLFYADCL